MFFCSENADPTGVGIVPDSATPNTGPPAHVSCPWCGFWSPHGAACDVCGSPLLAPKVLSITQLPDPGRSLEEQLSISVPEGTTERKPRVKPKAPADSSPGRRKPPASPWWVGA